MKPLCYKWALFPTQVHSNPEAWENIMAEIGQNDCSNSRRLILMSKYKVNADSRVWRRCLVAYRCLRFVAPHDPFRPHRCIRAAAVELPLFRSLPTATSLIATSTKDITQFVITLTSGHRPLSHPLKSHPHTDLPFRMHPSATSTQYHCNGGWDGMHP